MVGRFSNLAERWSLGADFDRFWSAAAISNLGDGIQRGALPLVALSITEDARLIGLVSAATLLPWLVFGPVGGVIVDRVDRRRLMIVGQVGRAVLAVAVTALVTADAITVWALVALVFGLGIGEILVDGSAQSATPLLVAPDQLDRANGRLIATISLFDQVVGVAIGAALFAVAAGLPFAVDAATFVIGAMVLSRIERPLQGARTRDSTVRTDIAEGLRYLLRHRLLRGLMLSVGLANFAGNIAFGVFVILLVDDIGTTDAVFGLVLAVGAGGGVIGSLVAASLVRRFGRRPVMLSLPAILAASYVVNAAAQSAWVVAASFFASSFAIVCFNIPGQSIRQQATPEHLLGRVVTAFRMFALGVAPLGALLGGFITQATNVRIANLSAAAITVIAGIVLAASLRHLEPQRCQ